MERDSLLGRHERRIRNAHHNFPDLETDAAAPSRRIGDSTGWRSRAVELRRSELEKVCAVFWSRGDELVVTLQWMVMGEDGRWMPVNTPPEPGFLREW